MNLTNVLNKSPKPNIGAFRINTGWRLTYTYQTRNFVDAKISALLNDLRALEHEIRATGLAEYAAVVDRAVQELCRVHADPKVAEQIGLPERD